MADAKALLAGIKRAGVDFGSEAVETATENWLDDILQNQKDLVLWFKDNLPAPVASLGGAAMGSVLKELVGAAPWLSPVQKTIVGEMVRAAPTGAGEALMNQLKRLSQETDPAKAKAGLDKLQDTKVIIGVIPEFRGCWLARVDDNDHVMTMDEVPLTMDDEVNKKAQLYMNEQRNLAMAQSQVTETSETQGKAKSKNTREVKPRKVESPLRVISWKKYLETTPVSQQYIDKETAAKLQPKAEDKRALFEKLEKEVPGFAKWRTAVSRSIQKHWADDRSTITDQTDESLSEKGTAPPDAATAKAWMEAFPADNDGYLTKDHILELAVTIVTYARQGASAKSVTEDMTRKVGKWAAKKGQEIVNDEETRRKATSWAMWIIAGLLGLPLITISVFVFEHWFISGIGAQLMGLWVIWFVCLVFSGKRKTGQPTQTTQTTQTGQTTTTVP